MSTETTPPLQIVQGTLAAHAHAQLVALVPEHARCNYEFSSPLEIQLFDSDLRDAGIPIRRWVLGDPTAPLATAFCFRATWNTPRHTFWGHIRVRADVQHQGYGTSLLHTIQHWATAAGARSLRLMAHPDAGAATMLAQAGYAHIGTEQQYSLLLPATRAEPHRMPADVQVLTLAAFMQQDPEAIEQACQLHAAISLDVPMPDEPVVTLSKFRRLVGAFVDPAQYLVAVCDGTLVGEAILVTDEHDDAVIWQHATGVLPAYRGLGIATTLKHAACALARAAGKNELRTWVETNNAPMLQINHEFGFRPLEKPGSTVLLYSRELKNGVGVPR